MPYGSGPTAGPGMQARMLAGRLNWRVGATVIIGCFILFGSAAIVSGIQSTASVSG